MSCVASGGQKAAPQIRAGAEPTTPNTEMKNTEPRLRRLGAGRSRKKVVWSSESLLILYYSSPQLQGGATSQFTPPPQQRAASGAAALELN